MKHRINPIVDCIFKCMLGSEKNKNLLIHFLNAVLEPKKGARIWDVTIKNPYNEREFADEKLSIVDVKAVDEKGIIYQIEIQLAVHAALSSRILYTWSSIYRSQIQKGDSYKKLKRVVSIWILNENLFEDTEACHLPFSVCNSEHNIVLTDHLAIHLLQLQKCKSEEVIKSEKERWIYLFKKGGNIDVDNPPAPLKTKEMRQAMKVLHQFSENEKDYSLYQSRLAAVLKENTYISELEEAMKEKEQALKEKKQAVKAEKQAEKEKEQAEEEKEQAEEEKEQAVKAEKQAVKAEKQAVKAEKQAVKAKKQAVKAEKKAKKQAVKEKKQVQDRLQDLLRLLKKKGIDPDKELVH
ncbi:MAG: Rpn family recombination-promoting nuclease/putative transposase [Gammaproteobacteria bacterium]|nr:Rpn family recombination-promoting nuclease/putative transposase [Gammaproteobacteria bacterium]